MSTCPACETLVASPYSKWKVAGRPDETGKSMQLEMGAFVRPKCGKGFRSVIGDMSVDQRGRVIKRNFSTFSLQIDGPYRKYITDRSTERKYRIYWNDDVSEDLRQAIEAELSRNSNKIKELMDYEKNFVDRMRVESDEGRLWLKETEKSVLITYDRWRDNYTMSIPGVAIVESVPPPVEGHRDYEVVVSHY